MKGLLIFYYLGGAGGKFIANCLTYSQQVAFTNYNIALRNNLKEYNEELLKTVPDREQSRLWLELEHGCGQMFGDAISHIKTTGSVPADAQLNDLTLLADQWVPVMAHDRLQLDNIQRYFKDVPQRLIVVDAIPEFIDLAIKLKWQDPSHCLDLNRYHEFKEELKSISADYTFASWTPLAEDAQEQIIRFARTLDITLDLTPAQDYIKRYQEFHR